MSNSHVHPTILKALAAFIPPTEEEFLAADLQLSRDKVSGKTLRDKIHKAQQEELNSPLAGRTSFFDDKQERDCV